MYKTILFSVLFVSLVMACLVDAQNCAWFYRQDDDPGIHRPDWMSELPDSLRLSELSIPGTHDAMARCGGGPVRCQNMRLDLQFLVGIRALDIRCRRYHHHFDITHSCFLQSDNCWDILDHYEFDDALRYCNSVS